MTPAAAPTPAARSALTVTVPPAGPVGDLHRAVLASVPARIRPVASGGEVALVSGRTTGWPARIVDAVRGGARGVLLTAVATLADPDEIRDAGRAARNADAVVVLDTGYASDRTWQQALPDWCEGARGAALLDSLVTVTVTGRSVEEDRALCGALLDQLAVIRGVVGTLGPVRTVSRSPGLLQATGRGGGSTVSLTAAAIGGPGGSGLTLDLVGAQVRRHARFDRGNGPARPAVINRFDQQGRSTAALRFESPHRAAWLDLHAAITGGSGPRADLEDLAADVATAATLLGDDA